jgi:hypothetical protein
MLTIPIYILKALDYGQENLMYATHSVMYFWVTTTAYITGELPATLLLIAWLGCVCAFVKLMNSTTMDTSSGNSKMHELSISKASYIKFSFLLLFNICAVGLMNGLYVYFTLLELDVWIHTAIQICFAFIKYVWNFIIVPGIVFNPLPISPYRSWLKLFVNMLNSVFIPCIASLFTSTSCFQVIIVNCNHSTIFVVLQLH